jgi:hypothetical protein
MTTTSILALLRILIDCPHQTPWNDDNLNTLIFSEYRDLITEITRRNADYYVKSATVSSTANNEFTDLPTDCSILKKLVNSEGNTLPWLHNSQFTHGDTATEPTYFDVVGRHIWWNPKPDAIYAYTAYYHYVPTDLTAGATPELPPDFHDILAYGVAVKSRLAKEDDLKGYWETYQQKKDNLLHRVSVSQTNNPRRVLRMFDETES